MLEVELDPTIRCPSLRVRLPRSQRAFGQIEVPSWHLRPRWGRDRIGPSLQRQESAELNGSLLAIRSSRPFEVLGCLGMFTLPNLAGSGRRYRIRSHDPRIDGVACSCNTVAELHRVLCSPQVLTSIGKIAPGVSN
jgi:hypothetical protein